ncbi:polysaccharide deacetylase family protein [Salininema proteolyticum]|uniref:Polysaccharide deacetylase family protein n=1 Tax=Salininema proteolyticum TaxID=1607685 RepID=A0ABV8TYL0_9ACTN
MTIPPATKRTTTAALAALVLFVLAACTDPSSPTDSEPANQDASAPSPSPTPESKFAELIPDFPDPPDEPDVRHVPSDPAPIYYRVPTDDKVAFITIDDGWTLPPDALELVREAGVPATYFLLPPAVDQDPDAFQELVDAGATVQTHTNSHRSMPDLSYKKQKREICTSADRLGDTFGERPRLFRPPFGEFDDDTLKAASACGMDAVLHWKEVVDGGEVAFQEGDTVQPGDMLLLHFRDDFVEDYLAALNAIADAGLTPALLEDYIPPAPH